MIIRIRWLEIIRSSVEESTFSAYRRIVKSGVAPYFRELGVTLADVEQQPRYIQEYYTYLMVERGNKATTVKRHHPNIRKALQYALKTDMIDANPADKMEKPKQLPYNASYYDEEKLNLLFEKARGSRLYPVILVAAFYGLRRGEVLGLKWSAVDFKNKTTSIRHTVGYSLPPRIFTPIWISTPNRSRPMLSARFCSTLPQQKMEPHQPRRLNANSTF